MNWQAYYARWIHKGIKKTNVANLKPVYWISYEWNEENHEILYMKSLPRSDSKGRRLRIKVRKAVR
jgi:hypothetical protein